MDIIHKTTTIKCSQTFYGGESLHCYDYVTLDQTFVDNVRISAQLRSGVSPINMREEQDPEEIITIHGPEHARAILEAVNKYLE